MFARLAAAGIALIAVTLAPGARAEDRLVVIATQTLDRAGSGVSIDVSAAEGAFRAIRIRAKSGAADLKRIQVIDSDGTQHNERREISLSKGERTRPLFETTTPRFLDTVNVVNQPGTGKVVIEVLGAQAKTDVKMRRADTAPVDNAISPSVKTGDDVMFGHQNVGFGIDRDVIKVGGDLGKFTRIRLRVLGNDVHVNTLRVLFIDGTEQKFDVDADIAANGRSDWFAIDGARFIREIQMTYRAHPTIQKQARVEVTGEYAKGWLGADGEGRKYHQGWVLLGAQTAGFTGFDRDVISIGANEGGFSRLRIEAIDRAITLKEIRVKFESGPDEVFEMRERVDPGKPYGPLEFKGGKAPIKSIEARYRSRFDLLKGLGSALNGRPAVVQIWGQH